jgi:hypothetical protein
MSLEDFLEEQCEATIKMTKGIRDDLEQTLIWERVNGERQIAITPIAENMDKDALSAVYMSLLQIEEAVRYAVIQAVWTVVTSNEEEELHKRILEEGTIAAESRREEGYLITAGDSERTIHVHFKTIRDKRGRIEKLERKPPYEGPLMGRFIDLLIKRRDA